jgi:pseudaminic acid synthase
MGNEMEKVFIVAELSANHGHDIDIVKKSILKAKEIGCDAVKIQTLRPELITLDCDNEYFRIDTGTIWDGTTLFDLYNETYLPWEWHREIFDYARGIGMPLFSTPFDKTAVDLLEECGNPVYKIASFEITDIPLIEYAAGMGKPMILSTGVATFDEIADAVDACRCAGNGDICLLQCTSEYPASPADANLLTMLDMKEKFKTKIGLSDHTEGALTATVAAAMGASLIEKHFILDKSIGGADASFSADPDELAKLIADVRMAEKIRGRVSYEIGEKKARSRKYVRSLFIAEDVRKGDRVTEENVRSVRPAAGLPPKQLSAVMGKEFTGDYRKGTPLSGEMIRGGEKND